MSGKISDEKIDEEVGLIKAQIFNQIEDGSLIVITVGDSTTAATKKDIQRVATTVNKAFEGVKGIRIMVVPHLVKIEKLSLPVLRDIQSKIITSWEEENDSIVIGDVDFGIMGDLL